MDLHRNKYFRLQLVLCSTHHSYTTTVQQCGSTAFFSIYDQKVCNVYTILLIHFWLHNISVNRNYCCITNYSAQKQGAKTQQMFTIFQRRIAMKFFMHRTCRETRIPPQKTHTHQIATKSLCYFIFVVQQIKIWNSHYNMAVTTQKWTIFSYWVWR